MAVRKQPPPLPPSDEDVSDIDPEIMAMRAAVKYVTPLDEATRKRYIDFVIKRFGKDQRGD